MKTNHKLITIAASFLAMVACGNIDDLEDRVDKIENRVSALEKVAEAINGNVQALQAIASGQAKTAWKRKMAHMFSIFPMARPLHSSKAISA